MARLPMVTWIRFFVWLAIGLVIYFTYGRYHSRVDHDASARSNPAPVATSVRKLERRSG